MSNIICKLAVTNIRGGTNERMEDWNVAIPHHTACQNWKWLLKGEYSKVPPCLHYCSVSHTTNQHAQWTRSRVWH